MAISGARQKRLATQYGIGSGGTTTDITVSGVSYKLHTFTSDGNFVVSTGGWFDVLLVGGGGASGFAVQTYTGGGGAGGVVQQTVYLSPATYPVDVGAGGAIGA
ncbi:MAG: glycine-rich domain-containing protein, partial [Bacteroidota bacterium]